MTVFHRKRRAEIQGSSAIGNGDQHIGVYFAEVASQQKSLAGFPYTERVTIIICILSVIGHRGWIHYYRSLVIRRDDRIQLLPLSHVKRCTGEAGIFLSRFAACIIGAQIDLGALAVHIADKSDADALAMMIYLLPQRRQSRVFRVCAIRFLRGAAIGDLIFIRV